MKKYKILLIGCGHMGGAHLAQLYCREDMEIFAVADTDLKRAGAFARKYGASHFGADYRAFLAGADIAIAACYPSLYLQILQDCIENNVHLLCEKPIAPNWETALAFINLAKTAPIKVGVGHILRHHASYRRLAEMIGAGAIGAPVVFRMSQNHHTMDWEKYRRLIEETSPIIDCGVHYFDVMRWFTGAEPVLVQGIGARTEADIPPKAYNYGLVTVHLSDGSVGYYEAGWGNTVRAENTKEFIGPKGRLRLTLEAHRTEHREEGDLIEYYQFPEKTYTAINILADRRPTGSEMDALLHMIENNAPPLPSYEDVLAAFRMAVEGDKEIRRHLPAADALKDRPAALAGKGKKGKAKPKANSVQGTPPRIQEGKACSAP